MAKQTPRVGFGEDFLPFGEIGAVGARGNDHRLALFPSVKG